MFMNANTPGLVKSAIRTLQVFKVFAEAGRALSLAELARTLAIPRSSCLALLRTMSSNGFLYQVGANAYYPTRMLYNIAEVIARNDPLVERVRPVMIALRDQTRETVILGKRHDDKVIYLMVVESEQIIRYSAHPGDIKPMYNTSSGRAILAALGEEERKALIARMSFARITPRTVADAPTLETELRAGIARGWQFVDSENTPDVIALGAPVNLNGDIQALVVTGPRGRMKGDVNRYGRSLVDACRRLDTGSPEASRAVDEERRPGRSDAGTSRRCGI